MSRAERNYPQNLGRYKKTEYIDLNYGFKVPIKMDYYEICKNPSAPWILITYGIHTDEISAEKELIEAMEKIISPNSKNIPNILFVPNASPAGKLHKENNDDFDMIIIMMEKWLIDNPNKELPNINYFRNIVNRKTYLNASGNDSNWAFDKDADPEILMIKKILDGKKFDYSLHLHHDNEMEVNYFYAYLTSEFINEPNKHPIDWNKFIAGLQTLDYEPYAYHYDDNEKPELGNLIPTDGLLKYLPDKESLKSFEIYLIINNIVQRGAYTIELHKNSGSKNFRKLLDKILLGFLDKKAGFIQ